MRKRRTDLDNHTLERQYVTWTNMRSRCYRPSHPHYHRYGGRGITVCDAWRFNYYAFRDWLLAHGDAPGMSIDRIDNNGNYTPENCQVIPHRVNCRKRESTGMYKGRMIRDIERDLGLGRNAIWSRINKYGWPVEAAMTTPGVPNEVKRFCKIARMEAAE
jgi:hypothetical protein